MKGDSPERRDASSWAYKKLSSVKTSIYLLGLLSFFYIIGTIFPQGGNIDEYIKAGGKYVFFVRLFDLLDFFSSPVFLIAAFLLLLNLAVCSYQRYVTLFAKRTFPKAFEPTHTFYLTQGMTDAVIDVRRVLRENLGFKLVSKDNTWVIMERGLPCRLLTWLYHAGIIVSFLGFTLTYLLAYEDTITLKPGKAQIVAPEATGRLQSLWKSRGGPAGFDLLLDEFITEYNQVPSIDYPVDKASRLAIGLGWKAPSYSLKEESLAARDWRSRLKVKKGNVTLYQKTIEVNDPLRYGGYTFYQEGFEQRLKIRVDLSPIALETKSDEELIVPGLDTPLKFGTVRTGSLHRLDGGIEKLRPFTTLKRQTKGPKGEKKYEDTGRLELGGSIDIDGKRLTFADFEESSVLSYRYDPGAPILWWSGIFVLVTMCLRFFGRYYMVAYRVDEADRIVYVEVNISSKGIGADREKLAKRLEYHLTRDDIKPSPLPPSVE